MHHKGEIIVEKGVLWRLLLWVSNELVKRLGNERFHVIP